MNTKAIHRQLLLLKTLITGHSTPRYNTADESPLRAELFSADQMEQHGKHLATLHKLTQGHVSDQLLSRLSANEEVLVGVCRLLTTAVTANTRISPAEEWLLDNFYLIEEQIRTAKRHLPKGYSRELPRLLHGPSAGLPRVYDIALEIISYGDGRVDVDSLTRFVASYQTLTALKLGELWAIPIMLRLALIENLRRVAACISLSRMNQELAIFWANKMMEVAKKDPKSLILVIADMARSKPPMVSSFVAELVRRLQGQSSALALPLTWIEQWLSEANLTIEQLIQSEAQRQAADQVSIGNSIGSLRLLTTTDWRDFVETLSVVEQTLGRDPAGIYLRMDFATRDRYRHEVERIAKRAGLAEGEVAQAAMQLAGSATARSVPGNNGDTRTTHIGYYLIDQGVSQLEQAVKLQRPPLFRLQRLFSRYPLAPYLGVILLLTLAFTAELLSRADSDGLQGWRLLSAALLLLLASSQLAIGLVNWLATLLTTPHSLPRMDFSLGIPAQSRTLVVIPTMLTSTQNIEELVEALEVRFLGNRDDNLHFGLLTDWRDASEETMAEDETLLQFAAHRIGELNNKYRSADPVATSDNRASSFFLFHRPRLWNPQEQLWMGYERKRGKLADLNTFLRGNKQRNGKNRFALIVGNTGTPGEAGILAEVRYVITLDTDTQLPRESAQQFVATMAHPLNRPLCDQQKRCVSAGYGILQPSVRVSLTGDYASHYERLWGSELGIDPYTRAVSDVYQDIFAEGSFIGKGIYEVDAFEWALNDRFPENRILSHDLLEGCYARCGLLSDSHLYEDYPARYSMDVSRRHRWIRGDWQLLSWLRRKVPGAGGQYEKNPLSMLSQWKIFDNLRRSLTSTALCLLLLLGWTVLSPTLPSVWFWTGAVVGIILLPSLSAFVMDLFRKPAEVLLRQHLAAEMRSAGKYVAQATLTLICLPFDAYISLDAIVRSLWRMLWSRKRLLEWNPASNLDAVSSCRFGINRTDLSAAVQLMWVASLFALLIALYLSTKNPDALTVAFPILALWFFSPLIMWWMSRPVSRDEAMLSAVQITFLRKISRKTWAFFETFVSAADNWLPPDNYQEYRGVSVAHRTSPTNIGLALLSNLSAYDFAYIPAGPLLERTAHTLNTMQKLQRYQGHFYNWYDTLSLQPLHPLYISSVDSGNLASNLLILRSGLHGLIDAPIVSKRVFEGLQDTLELLADGGKNITLPLLKIFRQNLEAACASPPATLSGVHVVLERLTKQILRFTASLDNQPKADVAGGDVPFWAHTLARQCQAALDELMFLAPWLELSPVPADLDDLLALDSIPSLSELVQLEKTMLPLIKQQQYAADDLEQHRWLDKWQLALADGSRRARERMQLIEHLVRQAGEFAHMEYDFLYDKKRHLLAIGYNADERRRDASFYDLLASEARLCVFVAIAQGQLPQESWFALGRTLTSTGGEPTLISWSGSMFEYLMPLLIMPTFGNTLIDQTYRAAVQRQIEYGKQCGVPWGISECGYNVVDGHFNYQYRAFGVPGLGLKRGLADDLVIAPYASALALTVAPEAACHNLQRLADIGLEGRYGFYEAIDYTASRQRRGEKSTIIHSFMAHHQGMSLLSLTYLLLDRPMQQRFIADTQFQSALLLLQERIPPAIAFHAQPAEAVHIRPAPSRPEMQMRVLTQPNARIPEVQLLSNGRYHVMVTHAGGGNSRWRELAVTRWREDMTCDNWGSFCYIREIKNDGSGEFWSTAYQPSCVQPTRYEAIFSEGRAEFRRRDGYFDTHTEIVVSPEDDIELRRVRITNGSRLRKTIEVTSYAEVVLAPPAADAMHPAFSNLFVQTEILTQQQAILCTRRPRSKEEHQPWMFHLMAVHGAEVNETSYETDRMQFIGRGHTLSSPQAMNKSGALSGHQGSVLDPVVSIRNRITLDPEQTVIIDIVCGIYETRDGALAMIGKYHDQYLADRVLDLAWTHSQVVLQQLNASEADAQLYARLASSIIYANPALRANASILIKNQRGQSGLWGYAISGDLPIVLLHIGSLAHLDLVRQMVQAHAYWRIKGLAVDLVIWNEDHAGYRQLLQEQIIGLIATGIEAHVLDRPGGIFVRPADQISSEDRILLQSVARVIIVDNRGSLEEQINREVLMEATVPRLIPTRIHRPVPASALIPRSDLILANGLGGFTRDGREYIITTDPSHRTPAPWSNVLANPNFGTLISESGQAYTWGENAHEFRLTPWHNDPVSDLSGEALYLRDEESGHFWSPTPLPCPGAASYTSRHGFGYSVFEHNEGGIHSELTVYVATDVSLKFSVLKVRNESGRARKLTATGYVEWVLGDLRPKSAMHVVTEIASTNALLARNAYNTEFAGRVAFFDVDAASRMQNVSMSGDRSEFIGRNGSLHHPAAMTNIKLSGKTGAGLDPCAAIQVPFDLADGEAREIIFRLGLGGNAEEANHLMRRFRGPASARSVLEKIYQHWNNILGAVRIETPDPALDVLTNGWLLYQIIACRLWARSGYYQSGGAFGFRDQLQDVMALIHSQPQLVRAQLLLCASRQFREGDVQHWWHPPAGRGVRTRCSDDYLWLPLAACRYVLTTGDTGVLDESVPFLEGRAVNPDEDSYYDLPGVAQESAVLYQHCVRAIKHALIFGEHGLPLIGIGDWNDGMNLVGIHGKGESVWLGFFLCEVLRQFTVLARRYGDEEFAAQCQREAAQLRQNIEQNGWDGEWYRRAYFDDGTPLGSASNSECQIDSISQSWSVLSGMANAERSHMAMDKVYERLVHRDYGLVQLLHPPFDKSEMDPGYIRGYVPGVRENGGQYTHAAIWTIMAMAEMGDSKRAWELLAMINPVYHGNSAQTIQVYKVEPYVVSADVYAVSPHAGRGGWSWYTGSAGWMYRLIVESLLGLRLEIDKLYFVPCLPADWKGYQIHYRYRSTVYHITLIQGTENKISVDGVFSKEGFILLQDDGREHTVEAHFSVRQIPASLNWGDRWGSNPRQPESQSEIPYLYGL